MAAEERTSLVKLEARVCFPFFPLERFEGVTLNDFEPAILDKWYGHKQLAVTQSHYNLYKLHHERNLARPARER